MPLHALAVEGTELQHTVASHHPLKFLNLSFYNHFLSLLNHPRRSTRVVPINCPLLFQSYPVTMATQVRERKPSTSAPISELKGPIGPDFTRPKHKRALTGFSAQEIKGVEASIPEGQREA